MHVSVSVHYPLQMVYKTFKYPENTLACFFKKKIFKKRNQLTNHKPSPDAKGGKIFVSKSKQLPNGKIVPYLLYINRVTVVTTWILLSIRFFFCKTKPKNWDQKDKGYNIQKYCSLITLYLYLLCNYIASKWNWIKWNYHYCYYIFINLPPDRFILKIYIQYWLYQDYIYITVRMTHKVTLLVSKQCLHCH